MDRLAGPEIDPLRSAFAHRLFRGIALILFGDFDRLDASRKHDDCNLCQSRRLYPIALVRALGGGMDNHETCTPGRLAGLQGISPGSESPNLCTGTTSLRQRKRFPSPPLRRAHG